MYRYLISMASAVSLLATSAADAQIVRVGPFGGVSVRAPFVSVDTLPFGGGARIRAPFTSIDTRAFAYGYAPGRYRYPRPRASYRRGPTYAVPVYPQASPAVPSYQAAHPTVSVDPAVVPERLRAAALRLKRSLSRRRDDGDVWLNYLDPDQVVAAIDRGQSPDSLRQLLRNYEGVSNTGIASVQTADGFRETHRLLQQFVQSTGLPPTTGVPPNPRAEPAAAGAASSRTSVPERQAAEPSEPAPAEAVQPAEEAEAAEQPEELPLPKPTTTPL